MPQLRPSSTRQGDRLTNDQSTLDPGELIAAIVDRPVDALLDALNAGRPVGQLDALGREHPDVDMFATDRAGIAEALQLCGRCEVRRACLSFALEHDEKFGVWGGADAQARKAMRQRRT